MYYDVIIKNKHGSISAGSLSRVKLTSVEGVGLPVKTSTSVTFANSPGAFTTSVTDSYRTITLAGDFYGDRNDVKGIYKILYDECTLQFINGTEHRQIKGRCLNPEDITRVGGGIWKFVFQFKCDDPYFYDFHDNKIGVYKRTDLWPNDEDENGNAVVYLPSVATKRTNEIDVINSGDLAVYPTIIIENIGNAGAETDKLTISNETTGESVAITHGMQSGETVIFNLGDREIVSKIDGETTEITNKITNETRLDRFLLELGMNHITVGVNSKNALGLTCYIIYRNKFLSAVI